MEVRMIWLCLGIIIGLIIRCEGPKHKSEKDKYEDPWNWTGFGG